MNAPKAVIEESPCKRYKRFNTLIGTGSFKRVYVAFDVTEGRDVAWCDVSLQEVTLEEREQFNNEVEILRSVDCEYIIRYYDSWHDEKNNRIVIITQYMPSGTILEYIRNKEISTDAIKNWSMHILHGLEYLHSREQPIIHKDLKCANLFIDGVTSSIRIGDLGLASHANSTDIVSGTLEYMAPEILESNIYNQKTDMYAFGMCLLELFTRKSPYSECKSPGALLSKVLGGGLPESLNEVTNIQFKQLVLLLIGSAEHRPSAHDLLEDSFLCSMNSGRDSPKRQIQCVNKQESQNEKKKKKEEMIIDPFNCFQVADQDEFIPVSYCKLYLPFDDTNDSAQEQMKGKDSITVSLLSYKENIFRLSFVRIYKGAMKPVKLLTQFAYGEDRIEALVSNLSRMYVIPEWSVAAVSMNLTTWLHKYLCQDNITS